MASPTKGTESSSVGLKAKIACAGCFRQKIKCFSSITSGACVACLKKGESCIPRTRGDRPSEVKSRQYRKRKAKSGEQHHSQVKITRSCDECIGRKTKCVADDQTGGCRECARLQYKCIYSLRDKSVKARKEGKLSNGETGRISSIGNPNLLSSSPSLSGKYKLLSMIRLPSR
jgi:hypothetical protein